ncbi:MAG: hypothetical protein JOZ15_10710, partial [Acidobacteria bacterium]|nr:hypothetical protein [Acidobacteriota bacterium]
MRFPMRPRRAGRALALVPAAFALTLTLALVLTAAGCGRHAGGTGAAPAAGDASPQGSDSLSQAERTKAMEA